MTLAAVAEPATEVLNDRYATRAKGGEKVGHLLARSWLEEPGRRGRPALCGQLAQKWRPVGFFDDPDSFTDCLDCSTAAGLVRPQGPTVRLAPEAPRRRVDPLSITPAAPPLTQAERHARRLAFRDSFVLAAEARGYVPVPLSPSK